MLAWGLGLVGVAFVGLASLFTSPTANEISVAVHGPRDSDAPEHLTLEVGSQAWRGYGGVTTAFTLGAQRVRLLGTHTCHEYAEFTAPAETSWVIRFAENGSVGVEDWTGEGMESGPALPSAPLTNCPDQPAFVAQPTSAGPIDVAPVLVVGLVVVVGSLAIAAVWKRRRLLG